MAGGVLTRLFPAGGAVLDTRSMNLAQTFWHRLGRDTSRPIFEKLEADGRVSRRQTRGELLEDASRWMTALRAAGIQAGDRVALSLGKADGLPTVHLAVLGIGAGVVPLNPALAPREAEAVLERAAVKLAITRPQTVSQAPAITAAVAGPWWVSGRAADRAAETTLVSDVLAGAQAGPEPVDRADDDLALLLFTSGTTGRPKGVGLSHRNLHANLQALLCDTWEMTEDDRLLHVLPPHHLHGLGLGLYGTLYSGCTAVLLERFDPSVVLHTLDRQRISVFMGVPTMYHRLLDVEEEVSLASMRLFTCGSAPLSLETFRRFQARFGFAPVERYGLTETAINTSNPLHGVHKAGSVGRPLPGVELGVFDPDTRRALPTGHTGELWVRGPNVFGGYWNDPEATAAAFDGSWFRTGDLGAVSQDGYVSIVGRLKELIIVGGSNVTPGEIEAVLELEAGVHDCAVAGLPDPDLGERIAAFIVPRPGQDPTELETRLRARAEHELAPYKRPRLYRCIAEIPRNAMGKVERAKLQP